jgi:hypothetical protein
MRHDAHHQWRQERHCQHKKASRTSLSTQKGVAPAIPGRAHMEDDIGYSYHALASPYCWAQLSLSTEHSGVSTGCFFKIRCGGLKHKERICVRGPAWLPVSSVSEPLNVR